MERVLSSVKCKWYVIMIIGDSHQIYKKVNHGDGKAYFYLNGKSVWYVIMVIREFFNGKCYIKCKWYIKEWIKSYI